MTPTTLTIAGGDMAILASRVARPQAPLIHFAHATGMCAGLYRPLLDRLSGEVDVVASDARGHGATTLAADPATLRDWSVYADDLAALLGRLPPPPHLILAGHSMGAAISMMLAARLGTRVAAVVLIEPAFIPFAAAAAWQPGLLALPIAAQAAKRRAVWPSRAAMRDGYRGRGVFATWADADLDAYLTCGVRDRTDGQVELACAPAWEAATFAAVGNDMAALLTAWTGPLTLLHGTERSTVMPADAATIAARPDTIGRRFDGADHFLPLTEVDEVAAAILARALPERGA